MSQQSDPSVRFTTMIDLYGLPDDFPELARHASVPDSRRRVQLLEDAMAAAVGDYRFIPNIQLHEFEALVLASMDALVQLLDNPSDLAGAERLRASIAGLAPEDINQGLSTAPSKRLAASIPGYRKTFHGPLATADTGLSSLRISCPRFDTWVAKLEASSRTQD
jgi:hypothetical protein